MNEYQDPAVQWSGLLARLDDRRREAVVAALRHSAESGWPASSEAVDLLVSYALDEITARQYAEGILVALGVVADDVERRQEHAAPAPVLVAGAVDEAPLSPVTTVVAGTPSPASPPLAPSPPASRPPASMSREEAVEAYVTGRIPVEEFLRIVRH